MLPDPAPRQSVCFGADSVLAHAIEAISERVVDPEFGVSRGDCDLAVAVDADDRTLRDAWSALRAGGSCYVEWRSPGRLSLSAVRRRLESAGFDRVAFYSPRPAPSPSASPDLWLPL